MQTVEIYISRADKQIAALTTLAISLHMLEATLPSPLPGVKPGIANIVVLFVLYRFGWTTAVSVSLLRVLAASLLFGQLFTPTFFLSLSGALCSLGVLWIARRLPSQHFSAVSLSLLAAMAHVFGQVLLVRCWLIPVPQTWMLLAPLLTAAVLFGVVNGLIVRYILNNSAPELEQTHQKA